MDQDTTLRTVVFGTADNAEIDRLRLQAKVFSTGSTGFWAGGKILGPDGKRYQVSVNVVEIGSKPR